MSDWLTTICAGVLCAGVVASVWFYQYPHSVVYSCYDKETHTAEIAKLCKQLTKNQWWGSYYQGVRK